MIKRLVSILLVVILLIPLTVFSDNLEVYGATNSDPNMYNDNAEFRNLDKQTILDLYGAGGTIGNYLGGMPATNANGLLVNVEMMLELGVIVYGSPSSVSTNEHVAMTQRTHPSTQGYFKGGVMNALGEYRYLGRDVSGHAFTNQAFVPDELNPNKDFASRTWVYQPWRTINWHPVFDGSQAPSPFHRAATDLRHPERMSLTTQWITKLVTDGRGDIGGGVIKNSTSQGNYNAVEHIHVSQNPTMRRTSKGVMFHETSSGAVFYQTLSDMPNMAQDVTPVITTVRVPTGQDLTFEKGATEVVFEVTVTGVLQDDDIVIDDALQSIYYDRHDIQHWEFELNPSRGAVIEPVGSPVVNRRFSGMQTATQRFRVRVASTEAGVVTLEGLSRPVFFNNESVQDTGLAVAHLIGGTEDFGSIFGVSDNIVVEKIGDLNKGHIGYRDMSFGDLTNYHLIITGSEAHNIHVPAPTESELPAFNNDIALRIRDFIYGEIGNETEGSFEFSVEQTVTQKGTGETRSFTQTITIVLDNYQPVIIEYEQLVQPDPQIPTKVFDLAPLNATDGTPAGIDNRVVKINGQVVDDNLFFSGNFVFGADFSDTWAFVEVIYTQVLNYGDPEANDPEWRLRGDEPVDMPFSLFIWVVDTKPKAQFETDGTFKENRLITIADDTTRANYAEVMAVYPIHSWEWIIRDLDGNNADLRIEGRPNGLVSQNHAWTGRNLVRLLSKQSGSYEVSLVVKNNVEGTIRTSDVFIQKFHVLPDEIPALITNIWASQILREDSIDMYYHGVSVDDDTISSSTVRLYHDHNNNGTVDHFIMQGTIAELKALTHAELGSYKFTVELVEEFGQPTIPAFVTPEDRRRVTNEVKFWVENLRPLTEIYVDIPIHLPEIDLHIMTDQNMVARTGANVWNKAEVAHISSNLVTINNALRLLNVRPTVTMRDLHTYVHETPGSATRERSSNSKNISSHNLPSSISYSAGGYSGTLFLSESSVHETGHSYTYYVYEDSPYTNTVSDFFNRDKYDGTLWHRYEFGDGKWHLKDAGGRIGRAGSSYSINSDGFKGSIPRVSLDIDFSSSTRGDNKRDEWEYTAYFAGSLSKEVSGTKRVIRDNGVRYEKG
ncbi:hypothetical protein JYT99_02940 [bacterium AH-315-E09]|nr:hypothetical protein [bacterium AH-315-E09]